jgi:hypothetical protein
MASSIELSPAYGVGFWYENLYGREPYKKTGLDRFLQATS